MSAAADLWERPERRKPRDSQRQKVYDAENRAMGFDEEPMSIEDCRKFVEAVWLRLPKSAPAITVPRPGWPDVEPGRGGGTSYGGMIRLGRNGRRKWVILHELAHEWTSNRYAAHGPEFVRLYLWLVERELGFEARQRLGAEMIRHRVRTRP